MFQSRKSLQQALASRTKKVLIAKNLGDRLDADFIEAVAREAAALLHKHAPNPLISARVLSAIIQRELELRGDTPPASAAQAIPAKPSPRNFFHAQRRGAA